MWRGSCESKPSREELCQSLRTLGEDLKSMPVRFDHNVCDCFDVVLRDSIVKEVTHRVHKYHLWSSPTERFAKFLWNKTQVESLLVWVTLHTAKSFSKHFGVAVLASGADLRAAANRIPRRISPLDGAVNAHVGSSAACASSLGMSRVHHQQMCLSVARRRAARL